MGSRYLNWQNSNFDVQTSADKQSRKISPVLLWRYGDPFLWSSNDGWLVGRDLGKVVDEIGPPVAVCCLNAGWDSVRECARWGFLPVLFSWPWFVGVSDRLCRCWLWFTGRGLFCWLWLLFGVDERFCWWFSFLNTGLFCWLWFAIGDNAEDKVLFWWLWFSVVDVFAWLP